MEHQCNSASKRGFQYASRFQASRYTLNNLYDRWLRPSVGRETCSLLNSRNISPPGTSHARI
ncbi:hypothetical protein E2C01_046095 [Portunus trituberculatus]|uniref:Uncharacterized protein n=1 Tax=Portunus trituberculatus TaxID=210409 RepID=A0A5B7G018_PORTR|nr:hypothetical protein [Portunus trituberculatus]